MQILFCLVLCAFLITTGWCLLASSTAKSTLITKLTPEAPPVNGVKATNDGYTLSISLPDNQSNRFETVIFNKKAEDVADETVVGGSVKGAYDVLYSNEQIVLTVHYNSTENGTVASYRLLPRIPNGVDPRLSLKVLQSTVG